MHCLSQSGADPQQGEKLSIHAVSAAQAAARIVLQDWNDGRIAYYTLPAARDPTHEGPASLVADWAPEFDAEAAYGAESRAVIAELQPLERGEVGSRERAGKPSAWFEATSGAGGGMKLMGLDEGGATSPDGGGEPGGAENMHVCVCVCVHGESHVRILLA